MDRRVNIVAAVVALVVTAGCGLLGSGGGEQAAAPDPASELVSIAPTTVEPTVEPTVEATTPSPTPTTVKPSATTKKPAPKPTAPTFNTQLPDCFEYIGKPVTYAKAKAALNAAANKTYWPGSAPTLKVPADLIRATAWHESGWTSNIENCDGGFGLMQVMPDTETFINQRFEQSYDYRDYRQNAIIGANQLAWLTRYFGEKYFKKNYDLSTARCRSDASPCLLNLVIDGYNMGYGSTEAAYLDGKRLSNPDYVHLIRANMRECDCDTL